MTMKLAAVLFDLDNTLVDFVGMKKMAAKAAAYAMVESGLSAERDALSEDLFNFYLGYWIEADDAFERFLRDRFGRVEMRVLAAGVNAYLKEKYMHLSPYPGVKEMLSGLKDMGLKLGVVSDGVGLKAWMRLNEAGIDGFFDVVVTHDDTGRKKPCPEPFRKALSVLGVAPEECLYVGDWPERDIKGARDCGMKTCLAIYGLIFEDGRYRADYEIKSPKELLALLKK
ncbi:MAG: HAD-IA family hydrolase [Candidatus Altiarchaeota archaeon]|nr:HAD-IA family hydrolase [Candidatus Altiarchaeota archaeon]